MDILLTVLLLITALLISNVVSHYIPFIPTALIQVALGIMIILVFEDISFDIETEWFLLLFIAPILYNDGRHFPREELWKLRGPILGNAVLLVLITTVAGGFFIHWMIDSIPLSAAFALAAILSPTDPVAVNGIAQRIHIPQKVLNLVRGESLINDASGLVAFNYAITAVVTGYFSLSEAALDFSYKFVIGAALGLVLGLLVIWIRYILRHQGINDVTFLSLLHIMTPFIIFIITENFLHASGVIAVVVAGIIHSLVRERAETQVAEEQMLAENIWTIILFILNGIVFLLLGLSIPSSMSGVLENPNINEWLLIGYVLAIALVILGIRFVWAYLFAAYEYRYGKMEGAVKPNLKQTLFVSLTGVRGTVTMVGVLSIPFLLENGEDFPNRSLIIFLAAGTILVTLIAATILLPLLSRGRLEEGEQTDFLEMEEARRRVLLASIKKIKSEMNEENEVAAYELMDEYKLRLQQTYSGEQGLKEGTKKYRQLVKELRLKALKAERDYIEKARKKGMDQQIYEAFKKSLHRREEAVRHNVRSVVIHLQGKLIRAWRRFLGHYLKDEETRLVKVQLGKEIQLGSLLAAREWLKEYEKSYDNKELTDAVISDYNQMISGLQRPESQYNEQFELQKEELRIIVMDNGRAEINRMYAEGDITREQARELRRYVNYIESITLFEHGD